MRAPRFASEAGTTLIEVTLAMAVLTVGALGAAGVFTSGMQKATSSPGDLIATQKAQEAVESVFAARDSHKLTWAQIRNVQGESGSDGGVFLDGKQQLKDAGNDGLVNTTDDGAIEEVRYPGRDRMMRTGDDTFIQLGQFWREIQITQVSTSLRVIKVTMSYPAAAQTRTFTLTTYISNVS
jgi:type II secretory pathway component PulJ